MNSHFFTAPFLYFVDQLDAEGFSHAIGQFSHRFKRNRQFPMFDFADICLIDSCAAGELLLGQSLFFSGFQQSFGKHEFRLQRVIGFFERRIF